MVKSKSTIKKQTERKTNTELVKTITAARKHDSWFNVAEVLSSPRRIRVSLNLEKIDRDAKEGEIIVIPGKVLSQGEISKKIKISALNFSDKARDKLLKAKCDVSNIADEIKKNPSAKGIRILK